MKKIPILSTATPGFKIAYLFLFLLIGLFVASLLAKLIFFIPGLDSNDTLTSIYVNSACQSIFSIALPAYLIVSWTSHSPFKYLKLEKSASMGRDTAFVILVFVVSYLFTFLLGQWNKGFTLPESMSSIEETLRSMEDQALEITDMMLSVDTIGLLLINILIVAVFAAIAEELFFRGALQQFIQEKLKNEHVTVLVAALVFSAVHFQFYGFLPRFFLGAILGYLYIYTRNLWVPIIFHFINNASVLILNYFWGNTEWYNNIDNIQVTIPFIVLGFISLIITILTFVVYKKINIKSKPDAYKPDNNDRNSEYINL